MFRSVFRFTPCLIPIFRRDESVFDQDHLNKPLSSSPQTGWDRVKQMYSASEHTAVSPELNIVFQSTMCGAFVGCCLGGFVSSRIAYLNFIENNQATIYKSTAEAKKKLQDYVTVAFARGAYKWGWRLAFFTGMFSITATTISTYFGNTSILEFVIAGALTGALYKIDMGLAGTLVGTVLGAVLSTIAGLAILGILKVTGVTMDEIRNTLLKLRQAREDQYNQALEKSAVEKHDEYTEHHKLILKEKGELKIEDIK